MNEVEAKKSAKPAPFTDEELLKLPLVLNSEQTARILGCSRSKLQSMCRADAIEFQRFQNRFTFNRDYVFKLAGISYESLYKTVSERCLAREKVKEQYAPLFRKYGVDIFGGEPLLGAVSTADEPIAKDDEDEVNETLLDQIGEAQLGKLLLKALLKNA
ncbi:hypothetical protein [Collinsella aerofaciens]|uniref:hypothetical protein n=1 Tax=Collinsella aerofaciens TaxID=74426 RepID=UPI00232E8A00|nr:hypothetical protein [Collinsella aerofaciens]MDB1909153.1 hypothetical protein [Collinsella aerofaciens]MDB1911038.1 hypothetical protein [Collinsella aerofaciens]MDB1912942.1 hypothetical protein [Collinsella aerofaciens]